MYNRKMRPYFITLFMITTAILGCQPLILAETVKDKVMFDAKYILASPKGMKAKGYLTWAAVLGLTAIMYSEKEDIRDWVADNKNSTTDDISRIAKPLGNAGTLPAIATGFYLLGVVSDNPKTKETGLMIIESFCYTGAVVLTGQYVFADKRPNEGGKMHFFKTGGHGISGHAALASAIAGPLNRQYLKIEESDSKSQRIIKYSGKAVVYGYPVLTGLSRMNDDKHYAWNVLLGLAVGYTMGELVADAHTASKEKDIALVPFVDYQKKGIIASIKF